MAAILSTDVITVNTLRWPGGSIVGAMIDHTHADTGLGSMIVKRSSLTPDRPALTFEGETWDYRDFVQRIERFVTVLSADGVGRGDRVGYIGLNHPNFFVAMFASARLGAIFVPINFRLTGPELAFIVTDSGCHTMIADDMHQPVVDGVRDEIPTGRFIGAESGGEGWELMTDLIESAEPTLDGVVVDSDDVAMIMYTSGTTGLPKGAMLTHGNFCWNNINALHAIDLGSQEVALVVAPIFHIGGLNVTTVLTWQKGGEVVLHRSFDPGAALEAIQSHGVTNMFGVPAMFLFMSQHPEFDDTDLTSLGVVVVGGAPVPEPLTRTYLAKGVPFAQGYGLTETAPMASFLLPEYALDKVGSAGFAPLYTDLAVLDDDGNSTPSGERGEICVKGPSVMKGYWNQPEATAEAIDSEGWFHSGDIGYLDDQGFLFVVDRLKDMVISGGENVYPAEVESVLFQHPCIADVAIIGLADERWGEAVTAIVVCGEGESLTLEDLRDWAGEKLARYKLPTRLHTTGELPRTSSGKVLKYELRVQFGD